VKTLIAEKYHCPECKEEWETKTRRTWLCPKCKRPGMPGPLRSPAPGGRG
jgi:ribosomal protein L37AE/L43A